MESFEGNRFLKMAATEVDHDHTVSKRMRMDEEEDSEPEDELEKTLKSLDKLLSTIGGSSKNPLERNIDDLVSLILSTDLTATKHVIIKSLINCIINLPHKLCIYSTTVGLLNADKYKFGGEFIDVVVRRLKDSLKSCSFEHAKILVRLLADLVNCRVLTVQSILKLFENFLEVIIERDVPQVRSDIYVYIVLAALPWVGQELNDKAPPRDFDRLLQAIGEYISKRRKAFVPLLRVWSADSPHPQEDYLDCLWAQVKALAVNRWREMVVVRPYQHFSARLDHALQHELPYIMPASHTDDSQYPLPCVVFRMFDYADLPEGHVMPGYHTIERYLIEEHLQNVITAFHLNRDQCAQELIQARPAGQQMSYSYSIVEVIFGQMLNLPFSARPQVFYASLIIELFRCDAHAFPLVVMQATQMLYERLDTMNLTCIERFVDWFSFHLANHMFRWTWNDWIDSTQVDVDAPKPKFIREVLEKSSRLYSYERVAAAVPAELAVFLPPKPDARYKFRKPKPVVAISDTMDTDQPQMYGEPNENIRYHAQQVWNALKQKATPEEVLALLNAIPRFVQTDEQAEDIRPPTEDFNRLAVEIVTCSLFFLKRESISHSLYGLINYKWVLQMVAKSEPAQICLLNSIFSVWGTFQKMMCFLVEKLLKEEVLESTSVVDWLFSESMRSELTKFYVWDILNRALDRQTDYVIDLQHEIDEQRDNFEAANRKLHDGLQIDMRLVPTLEEIERKEDHLRTAVSRQQNLFIRIFQKLHLLLAEHLSECEKEGVSSMTPRFKWLLERLQQMFLNHHDQVSQFLATLERDVFTSEMDFHILHVFQQFAALKS